MSHDRPETHRGDLVAATPGDLSRRIAEIALEAGGPRATAERVAPLLACALDAAQVAIFAVEAASPAGRPPRTQLDPLAAYPPFGAISGPVPGAQSADLQRVALHALAGARRGHPSRALGAGDAHVTAVPLGKPGAWAVVVVRWEERRATLFADQIDALTPTLALALRPSPAAPPVPAAVPAPADLLDRRATIFALSSDAILTIDHDFVVREANPASAVIMGWPAAADLVGRRCSDLLRCRDARKLLLCDTPRCPLREAFAAEAPAPPRDLCWETRSSRLCEVSATFTVRRDAGAGSGRRAVVVARDVTVLNAANRVRANFVSMVSHELRTPLNSIYGFLDIVLDGQTGALTPKQREFLTYALVSAQQLTTLVEDVLLLSKGDAGQYLLRLAPVDVAQLVAGAVQIAEQAAAKAQVTLCVDGVEDLPAVYGDDLRLSQVLNNLLGNAIKFSDTGTRVTLSACHRDDEVELAVSDAGCGVAYDEQARIFERFYQGERAGRRAGGYGLGLAIAKLLVEQHGGRIWVESEPDSGATFRFTIPVATDEQS